jgi:hydroxymethylglutaryl-CoA reductase
MSILSNYVPECLVRAKVSCPVDSIAPQEGMDGFTFAQKMVQAIEIANVESYRAVTHNKGIMNGVDALVLATGNDFRAIEAGVHAYAARSGQYASLSQATIIDGQFTMELTLPLAIGTVGGLTKLHPMVGWCMELLEYPDAETLMKIIAVAGLAQNFAALRSLVTSGIQKGHMKMHLFNILNQLQATEKQKEAALVYFKSHTVSVKAVGDFLSSNKD